MRRFFLKLLRRRSLEQDLQTELAFHREMAAAQQNAVPLGNEAVIREEAFDVWRFNFIENLWRDLRYAIRSLRRSPSLVFTALLSLALGIGANTALFSLGAEFLFSEPTATDPAAIVSVGIGGNSHASVPTLNFLRESGLFQSVVGENEESFVNWNDGAETHRIFTAVTTRNYFTEMGVPMSMGRGYSESDPKEVVVLHHNFWVRRFGADPSVVGRAIELDGRPYTVVGVLPVNYRSLIGFGFSPDVYLPMFREDTYLAIYARLKAGMPLGQARSGMRVVAERMDKVLPESWKHTTGLKVVPVGGFARMQDTDSQVKPLIYFFEILLAVAGLVVLIACVNVASLLLARASARKQEFAVRLSLGASRGRLLQQMLAESLLLAMAGAGLGLLLAHLVATLLGRLTLPLPMPLSLRIELDWRVTLYAAFLGIVATVASGFLPAWQTVRESIAPDLKRERRMRLRSALVVAQISISLVVLATSFLFLRNLLAANSISPGFDVRHTVRAEIHLPPARYKESDRKWAYSERALRELAAIPGIESAAAARIIPFTDATRFGSRLVFPATGKAVQAGFNWNAVSPLFFHAMDIPLIRGRAFVDSDRENTAKVVIVNQTFAARFLDKKDPIGVTFLWGDGKDLYQVVGVAADTKNMTIGEDLRPQLYQPLAQIKNDRTRIQFVLRSATPPATQLAEVRRVLRSVEPAAGIEVSTLFSSIGFAFLPSQVGAALLGSIGFLGLLLAAVGLYGVMAYSVARRTREIGVRMAIGADRRRITVLVLREAAKLLIAGSIIGLAIALFVTKPLAMFFVPGLSTKDSLTFVAVVVVLVATGLLSTLGPIRRAISIDPMSSLRYE